MAANTMMKSVYRQFHRPTGMLGRLAGTIMARRASNRERNVWTVDLLKIQPEEQVLEIGFGPGLAIEQVAGRLRSGKVTGIDHSEVMVAQASRRNARAIASGTVALHWGGMELLARFPETFDVVLAVNVIHFAKDPKSVLTAIAQTLKPGGRVAITHQPRQRGATRDDALASAQEMKNLLLERGFRAPRSELLELTGVPAACVLATK